MKFAVGSSEMIRTLLLLSILTLPFSGWTQFFGGAVSYMHDTQGNNPWAKNHGIHLGLGLENHPFENSPLTISYRYSGLFNFGRDGSRIENITFDLPDSVENRTGYADIKFRKLSFGLEFDLGYQDSEYAIFEPYATLGARFSSHNSSVTYKLYEQDHCSCISQLPEEASETVSLGFTSGAGLKIHATETFFIDLRATYYGTWGLRRNEYFGMADPESAYIDPSGSPAFNYGNQNYFDGFEFRIGLIFKLNFNQDDDEEEIEESTNYDTNDPIDSSPRKPSCEPVKLSPTET